MFGSREYALFAAALAAFWVVLTLVAPLNRPRAAEGVAVFGHHWALRTVTAVAGPVLSLFFAVMAAVEPPNASDWPIFAGFFSAFFVLGGLAYWEAIRFGFAVTPDGIDFVSPWRGRWFMPWATMKGLSYVRAPGLFLLRSEAGTGCVGALVPKLKRMLEAFEQHLPAEKLKPALAGYSMVGRPFPYAPLAPAGAVAKTPNVDLRKWNER